MKRIVNIPSCMLGVFLLIFQVVVSSGIVEAAGKDAARRLVDSTQARDLISAAGLDTVLQDLISEGQILGGKDIGSLLSTSIPVPDNALGDMNQDSVISIWDLLRIRNIHLGIGDPPTSYELSEGDLNLDGSIDDADVLFVRDALFHAVGVPHVIGEEGGEVVGSEVTLKFGAGAVDSSAVLWVEDVTKESILAATGVNFDSFEDDSVYFMKGLQLAGDTHLVNNYDSLLVELASLPPCSLEGSNNLVSTSVGPFGEPQISYNGRLEVVDSGTSKIGIPVVSWSRTAATLTPIITSGVPGAFFEYSGTGVSVASSGNEFVITTPDGQTLTQNPAFVRLKQDGTLVLGVAVPASSPGTASISYRLVRESNELMELEPVEIMALDELPGGVDPDSLIGATLASLDTLLLALENYLESSELVPDTIVPGANAFVAASVCSLRQPIQQWADSAAGYDVETKLWIAELFDTHDFQSVLLETTDSLNSRSNAVETGSESLAAGKDWDWELTLVICATVVLVVGITFACVKCPIVAKKIVQVIIKLGAILSVLWAWCDYFGLDPGIRMWPEPPNLARFYQVCMNVWRHFTNLCGFVLSTYRVPPMLSTSPPDVGKQGRAQLGLAEDTLDLTNALPDFSEAIVTTDVNTIPPGIVGRVNEYGQFSIAGVPCGVQVTLSMYDPLTGLIDHDAGGALSPSVPERGLWFPAYLNFEPDTSGTIRPIAAGDWYVDSISTEVVRHTFLWDAPESSVGVDTFNIRMVAFDDDLSFSVQKPDQSLVHSNSLASCEKVSAFVPDQAGAHKLIVGLGLSGGDGLFAVGIAQYPTSGVPVVCGSLDINPLANDHPVYYVKENITVPASDTLVIEDGVDVQFLGGAHFVSSGWIRGSATPSAPIRLRPGGPPSSPSPTPNFTSHEEVK